jgi:Type IV secretion-system coupling protein DNA-binding domain
MGRGIAEGDRMRSSDVELLWEQFYSWELRGRGWHLWPWPVDLEPPFRPFFGYRPSAEPVPDDGRRHTLLSAPLALANWCLHPWRWRKRVETEETEEPAPDECLEVEGIIELEITLPTDLDVAPDLAEQFLLGLGAVSGSLAFEIVGLPKRLVVQFACAAVDADIVQRQLTAYFPQVTVTRNGGGLLHGAWTSDDADERNVVVAEFGLRREFMLPLALPRSFKIDPLLGIIAALADAGSAEVAVLQILFQPVRYPWGQSIVNCLTFADGSPLFDDPRDFIAQAQEKLSRPLYAVVIRAAARSSEADRALELVRGIAGAFATVASPTGNELFPLDNEQYTESIEHEVDLLLRRSHRGGMLLNSDELGTLVHLPSSAVREPKLRQAARPSRAAPNLVLGQGAVLGINDHAGEQRTVRLSADQRIRHVHALGASGTGKSTLLLNMIAQDMAAGDGVAVLDPHGDLVDAVLRLVPPHRAKDVILLDPSDEEYPIGFNVLSAHSAMEKDLLASDLIAVFRRLSTSWGDQMNSVLGNAILAFLESERGGTLSDVRRFLVEMPFRKEYLRTVRDPEVVYYWTKEFPLLTGRPQGPVLTRLDTFLRPKPIRYMVAQRNSPLDFADILDNSKILLARLSHGVIGAENAYLLGTLLVSKLHQLALGRQRMREEERRYFWLYIDECHHFATPSMATILSGVRKYRMGLVLAHQELQQLEGVPEFAAALLSNAYTRVCFRLGDQDARKLESGFAGFNAQDLQNLGTGEAICRVERAERDFNLRTTRPPTVSDEQAGKIRDEVVRLTRERYAVPRAQVEAAMARSRGVDEDDPLAGGPEDQSPAPQRRRKSTPNPPSSITPREPASTVVSTADIPLMPVPFSPLSPPQTTEKLAGRGGPQHQHLQRMIKQWAEGMGYKATIEGQVMGVRAADVAIEKGEVSIACELCITTGFVHELGNIRKCLDAGFTHVAAISPNPARLTALRAVVEQQLDEGELERIRFCTPDEFFAFVQEMEGSQVGAEGTIRGYKVKTSYKTMPASEVAARQQQVAAVMAQAMRRLKNQ